MFVNPPFWGCGHAQGLGLCRHLPDAALGLTIMALYANYPDCAMPGMGWNAYFAYVVGVPKMGYTWEVALGRCPSRDVCS